MHRLAFIVLLLAAGCCSTDGFSGGPDGFLRGPDDPYTIQRADRFEQHPIASFFSFLLGSWDD